MANNKVKYGLSNVYYAVATIAEDGTATYTTPKRIAGAVNLSLDANGSNEPFYADNIKYYVTVANNGYDGDLEIALVPDEFRKDVLGDIEDTNGILVENADAQAVQFALLFQFEGDANATRHVIYNCTATRPSVSGATKEESVSVQTETLSLSCATVYNEALEHNVVKARALTTDEPYADWFKSVYQPTA